MENDQQSSGGSGQDTSSGTGNATSSQQGVHQDIEVETAVNRREKPPMPRRFRSAYKSGGGKRRTT